MPLLSPELTGLLHSFLRMGFSGGSTGKESACNVGDLGMIPGLGRSPGGGKGYSLQYSDLENSMGSQRVGQDSATFTFTSLSRKHMSHTRVLLTPFVCLLFFQVKIMFLKKVASSACNSHSCAGFLETIAVLQHARGLHVNCVIHRTLLKGV